MTHYLMNQQYGPTGAPLQRNEEHYVKQSCTDPTMEGMVCAIGYNSKVRNFAGTEEQFAATFTAVPEADELHTVEDPDQQEVPTNLIGKIVNVSPNGQVWVLTISNSGVQKWVKAPA